MLAQKLFDEINAKVTETLGSSPAKDFEKNLRAMLASTFSKMDLVTREEFDVQQELLLRTREKLSQLEARLASLEERLAPPSSLDDVAVEEQSMQGHS